MTLEITDQTIDEVLSQNEIVVIDFYATWCGPCKMLAPIIDNLSDNNPDILVGKLDAGNNMVSAVKYNITGIPCIVFIKNGKEELRVSGVRPMAVLQSKIDLLKI